eukprot:gene884-1381_t
MRVVLVDPDTRLGSSLHQHLHYMREEPDQCEQSPGKWAQGGKSAAGGHKLATQAVTLWGVDIPALLPPASSRFTPTTLQNLSADLDRANQAGLAGDLSQRRKAALWGLRRCLRAAGEVAALAGMGYTRDLYWCLAGGSEVCPAAAEDLLQALLWILGERPMAALEDIAAAERCATSLSARLAPFQEDPVLPTGEAAPAPAPQPSGTFGVREWQEERGSAAARYQAAARAVQGWAAALSGVDLEAGAAKGPRRSLARANIRGQVELEQSRAQGGSVARDGKSQQQL